MGLSFYRDLAPVEGLAAMFRPDVFRPVPPTWSLVITDVVGSTSAIESGRYKEVNSAGAMAVMALTNIARGMEFPFLFGGDGMTFLLPDVIAAHAKEVLADVRNFVRSAVGLELRVGIVPLSDLAAAGHTLELAKFKVSDHYQQAIFAGTAAEVAERWVKSRDARYLVPENPLPSATADLTGFSCRWQDVPSHLGKTIAIIVKPRGTEREGQQEVLAEVLETFEQVLGSEQSYHPISVERQEVSRSPKSVDLEASARSHGGGAVAFALWRLFIRIQMAATRFFVRHGISFPSMGKDVRYVREDNRVSSDYRKYDGTLKMVVACREEDVARIHAYLEKRYTEGALFYGLHESDRALMTCLVHVPTHGEVHFVDAADGGYALAAKQLKAQVAAATKAGVDE